VTKLCSIFPPKSLLEDSQTENFLNAPITMYAVETQEQLIEWERRFTVNLVKDSDKFLNVVMLWPVYRSFGTHSIITSIEGRRLCFHVCLFVCLCLSVCPLDYWKRYERILMKFFGGMEMVAQVIRFWWWSGSWSRSRNFL